MKKLLLYSLMFLLPLQCFSQKIITVKAKEIQSIAILPTKTSIKVLRVQNDPELYDSTKINWINQNVNSACSIGIDNLMEFIKLPNQKITLDSLSFLNYFKELDKWVEQLSKENKLSKKVFYKFLSESQVSDSTIDLIKSKNEKYGLCISNLGYTRSKRSLEEFKSKQRDISGGLLATSIFFGSLVGTAANAIHSATSSDIGHGNISSIAFIVNTDTKKIVNIFIIDSCLELTDKNLQNIITKNYTYPLFSDFWVWYHPEAQQFVVTKRK
jgi:hypothetical protein